MRIIWNEERIESNTELGETSAFKWTKVDQSVNRDREIAGEPAVILLI